MTTDQQQTQPETTLRDCPGCGMAREDWPDSADGGFVKGKAIYCCHGCTDGACTCKVAAAAGGRAPTEEEIRKDGASGAFVQSLQHQTKTITPDDYGTDVTATKPEQPSSGGLA